jgi:hypothetical protein
MRNITKFATMGFSAWVAIFSSLGLSEPYRVTKGDTLSSIAAVHRLPISLLKSTNHIKDVNLLRVGQIIIIPEPPSSLESPTPFGKGPNDLRPSPHQAVHKVAANSSDIQALRKGLDHGWVVTRNPDTGKIFVHEREAGGTLIGLRYLLKETANPGGTSSWTVYRPISGADGTTHYGRIVGVMDEPTEVVVGICGCG